MSCRFLLRSSLSVRRLSTQPAGEAQASSRLKLFPEPMSDVRMSFFKQNLWGLRLIRYKGSYEHRFQLKELFYGTKLATSVLATRLLKGEYEKLLGVCTPDLVDRLKQVVSMLDESEKRRLFDFKIDDWLETSMLDFRFATQQSEKFARASLAAVFFRGMGESIAELPQAQARAALKMYRMRPDGVLGNVRFVKRVEPTLGDDWLLDDVNFLNFRTAEYIKAKFDPNL